MGLLGLREEEELLLTRIVLNRAMLGECEGSHPPFLAQGDTLWAWFGCKSEQMVRDYQAHLLHVLEGQPRVQQALAQKDWYIEWHEGKYYATYRRTLPARLMTGLGETVVELARKKELQCLVVGIVIGMLVAYSLLKPECLPLLIHKVVVFVLCLAFYGIAAFLGGMFLFSKFVRSLDKHENCPWTRTQDFLFFFVLVMALVIGATMGALMVGEVRHDDNPWREEFDQTYPY